MGATGDDGLGCRGDGVCGSREAEMDGSGGGGGDGGGGEDEDGVRVRSGRSGRGE
jgi:hypothetical protein